MDGSATEESLVSIVLCTYNRAAVIGEAIRSVLDQDYVKFELIIVDDGSTDRTEEIVESFEDERIVFLRNPVNIGAAASRNRGISIAKGTLIAFQDSDDSWLPGKLDRQVRALAGMPDSCGACYTSFWRRDTGSIHLQPGERPIEEQEALFLRLLRGNVVNLPTLLVKKSCLDQVGVFDESFRRLMDWDLALRISREFAMIFCEEPLLLANHTEASISEDVDAYIEAVNMLLSKYADDYKKERWLVVNHYLFNAKYLAKNHELFKAMKHIFKVGKLLFDRIFFGEIRIPKTDRPD